MEEDWQRYIKWSQCPEREFIYEHQGVDVIATIWNEASNPQILYDYNNVLNKHTISELQTKAKIQIGSTYAIVSL